MFHTKVCKLTESLLEIPNPISTLYKMKRLVNFKLPLRNGSINQSRYISLWLSLCCLFSPLGSSSRPSHNDLLSHSSLQQCFRQTQLMETNISSSICHSNVYSFCLIIGLNHTNNKSLSQGLSINYHIQLTYTNVCMYVCAYKHKYICT